MDDNAKSGFDAVVFLLDLQTKGLRFSSPDF